MQKLKEIEINNLKKWASNIFKKNNRALDEYDIFSEIDRKINYDENKAQLREKLKLFFKEFPTKKEMDTEQDKEDTKDLEKAKEEEKQALKEFEISVIKLKQSEDTKIKSYDIPREYIKSVARGFNKSFIFLGGMGLGKTYLTRQTLAKEGVNFLESRGVNSPLALYQFLYDNNSEETVLVFDDVAGLIENSNALSILLGVLWEGVAMWNSTTDKLKTPKRFVFKGRIIIIANRLTGLDSEIIKSRCLVYNISLSRKDKIRMMYKIAKQKHKNLVEEERFNIVDFIKKNTSESISNLDLRTQHKAEQLYLYDKANWKKLVLPLFEKDNTKEILLDCLHESNTTKQAQEKFCKETGKSRRTFYNIKRDVGIK